MMSQANQKPKHNKAPLIIMLSLAAAFIIGALLCFFIPRMIKTDAPLELINNRLTLREAGGYYFLSGELKNVSDETVTIKNSGGMEVSFSGTDIKFDDCWLLKPGLPDNADLENKANYIDVVLEPGETYDFVESTNCFNASTSVTRLLVNLDGVSYNLYRNTGTTTVLIVIFVIFAIVFLVLAFTQNKNQRDTATRRCAVAELCASKGEQCYFINATVIDKDEKKKAAAKTAGWVFGAFLTTLFTGRGVYRVYSGNTQTEFVLNENALYAVNGNSTPNAPQLTPITRSDLNVASIETKKNKVTVKSADGKQTLIFFRDKKSPLTVEQIAEYLNNIFVKPLPQPETVVSDEPATESADPFADLAPEKTETIETTEAKENTEISGEVDGGEKADGE